jgi:hypothetical protein
MIMRSRVLGDEFDGQAPTVNGGNAGMDFVKLAAGVDTAKSPVYAASPRLGAWQPRRQTTTSAIAGSRSIQRRL